LPLGSEDLRLVTLFWRAVEDGRPLSLDEAARVARILFDAGGGDRLLAGLGQAVRAADCGELAALPTLQEVAGIGPPSKQAASARFKAVQVGLRTAYECVPRQSEAQRCLVEGLLREYGELFAWDAELGPTSRARGSVSPRTLRRYASRARFPEEQLRWLRGALQLIAHLDGPADEATLAELEDVERALDGPKGRRRSKMRGADPVKRRRARRQ
jgi:hypothetical protein